MTNKKLPSYIELLSNENVMVETKNGKFELEDAEYDKIHNVKKRCKGQEIHGTIAISVVAKDGEPVTLGERDVGKFKSSSIARLLQGLEILYDVEDIEELFQIGENE